MQLTSLDLHPQDPRELAVHRLEAGWSMVMPETIGTASPTRPCGPMAISSKAWTVPAVASEVHRRRRQHAPRGYGPRSGPVITAT